ncbi:MAG: hypothetical protein K2I07_11740 [Lachnospiraceae bacterium]|nr:hypothetical protein [Lachnospiraceae bacterium]
MRTGVKVLINIFLLLMIIEKISDYYNKYQILLDEEDIRIVIWSDHFLVEQKSILHMCIETGNDDEMHLTKEDIALEGFDADITFFSIYEVEGKYHCSIELSNLIDRIDSKEKSIEIGGGISAISGEPDSGIVLKPDITFSSVKKLVSNSLIVYVIANVILTFFAFFNKNINVTAEKCLLWCNILALGGITYACFIHAAQFGPDDKSILMILSLMLLGYLYHLFLAKWILGDTGYKFMIVMIGLGSILCLSNIFTSYYLKFDATYDTLTYKNVILSLWEWERELSIENCTSVKRQLAYLEFSFRYFFSLPSDESYGVVSIAQFLMGKIYEFIMIGSIASLILRCIRRNKEVKVHSE